MFLLLFISVLVSQTQGVDGTREVLLTGSRKISLANRRVPRFFFLKKYRLDVNYRKIECCLLHGHIWSRTECEDGTLVIFRGGRGLCDNTFDGPMKPESRLLLMENWVQLLSLFS